MLSVISMQSKTEVIYIRCSKELKDRMRILFATSGEKNYADFLDKLLTIYEMLMNKFNEKKIVDIIKSLNYKYILVE